MLYEKFKFEWKKTNASVFLEDKKCMVHHLDVFTVFRRAQLIQRMRKELNLTVLEIHSAELVHMPRQTINRICQFLGVECYKEYLDKCEEKVFRNVSITRNFVEWTSDSLVEVEQKIKEYTFFQRYSFHSE